MKKRRQRWLLALLLFSLAFSSCRQDTRTTVDTSTLTDQGSITDQAEKPPEDSTGQISSSSEVIDDQDGSSGTGNLSLDATKTTEDTPYEISPYEAKGVRLDYTALELTSVMGNGWNLGNTMEAYAPGRSSVYDCEQAWSMPITTKPMIQGIKEAGFDAIRIPVAWSNMMSDDGLYTIDPAYLERVEEIIHYSLDSGLYVMMNIHWDGGWWEDFGSPDETIRQEAMVKYKAIWTQLADYYKDYSHYLIFESANEELGHATQGIQTESDNYKLVTRINQAFVDIVRSSGGLNNDRYLLIAGYNTDIVMTTDDRYIMPTDTLADRLLISVHYYTPATYCIAGKKDNSWGYKDSWGSDLDKAEMDLYFAKMQKFTQAGFGVIIGEYGVTQKENLGIWLTKEGTDLYIQSVVDLSEKYGYSPFLWDASTWYARSDAKFYDKRIAAIFER